MRTQSRQRCMKAVSTVSCADLGDSSEFRLEAAGFMGKESRKHNRKAVAAFSPTLPPCGYVGSELTARTQPCQGCVVVHDRSQGSRARARQPWALRLNRFAVKG